MKKLSIFCILAVLCTCLASCDDTVIDPVHPDRTSSPSSTTAASVSRDNSNPSVSIGEIPAITVPAAESPEILYCSEYPYGEEWTGYTLEGVTGFLEIFEEYNKSYALCWITVKEIDYSLIREDELKSIPITVSIDRIIEKNNHSYLNEGDVVLLEHSRSKWKKVGNAFEVHYFQFNFPIAEVGKSYLAIVAEHWYCPHPADYIPEHPLEIAGISVPLPKKDELSDEYFKEQYKKLGLDVDYYIPDYFGPESLKKWFYPYIEAE